MICLDCFANTSMKEDSYAHLSGGAKLQGATFTG